MKKNYSTNIPSKIDNTLTNKSNSEIKTTDVNILLNRVRLEKKKNLNKRILISLILITSISLLAVYQII